MVSSLDSIKTILKGETEEDKPRPTYTEVLPDTVEIENRHFERLPRQGNYKVLYANNSDIAMLPNPVNDDIDDLDTQVAVWKHNSQIYEENGLSTAADFETSHTHIDGERYPLIVGDYNPHLAPISDLSKDVLEENWEDIVDYTVELDRLKRQGEIATAEPGVAWKKLLGNYDVVIDREIGGGAIQGRRVSSFNERPYTAEGRDGNYILQDFLEALWNDERLLGDRSRDIYLKESFHPKEAVMEEGIPSYSSKTLVDSLAYDEKKGSIVVDDLGEYSSTMFSDNSENRFKSGEEFLKSHEITPYNAEGILNN